MITLFVRQDGEGFSIFLEIFPRDIWGIKVYTKIVS